MRIPFANRTADVELPAAPRQQKVTVKSIIDDFRSQLPSNFEALFEAFVLLSPKKVRVTCRNSRALEQVSHLGLSFRNTPVFLSEIPRSFFQKYPGRLSPMPISEVGEHNPIKLWHSGTGHY